MIDTDNGTNVFILVVQIHVLRDGVGTCHVKYKAVLFDFIFLLFIREMEPIFRAFVDAIVTVRRFLIQWRGKFPTVQVYSWTKFVGKLCKC